MFKIIHLVKSATNRIDLYFSLYLCMQLYPFLKIFFNAYILRERERERERDSTSREGQRERGTQNLKQDPGSKLSAQSLTRGSNRQTVRS